MWKPRIMMNGGNWLLEDKKKLEKPLSKQTNLILKCVFFIEKIEVQVKPTSVVMDFDKVQPTKEKLWY